jgi:hypothetical protein
VRTNFICWFNWGLEQNNWLPLKDGLQKRILIERISLRKDKIEYASSHRNDITFSIFQI